MINSDKSFDMKQIAILIICSSMFFPASARERTDSISVKPDEVHQICLPLEFSRKLDYAFMSSRDLAFNIHYFNGDNMTYATPEKSTHDHAELFTAMEDREHCMMWKNNNDRSVKLNVIYNVR